MVTSDELGAHRVTDELDRRLVEQSIPGGCAAREPSGLADTVAQDHSTGGDRLAGAHTDVHPESSEIARSPRGGERCVLPRHGDAEEALCLAVAQPLQLPAVALVRDAGTRLEAVETPPLDLDVSAERLLARHDAGHAASHGARGRRVRRWRSDARERLVAEDGGLERVQRRRWLDSEFVDQRGARVAKRGQRFGVTPGTGERPHELRPERLAHGMLMHERLELSHDVGVAPERDLGVDPAPTQPSCSSSSRSTSAWAKGSPRTSARLGPRHSTSASPKAVAALAGSPAASAAVPCSRNVDARSASSAPGAGRSAYPDASVTIASRPSVARSRATTTCSAFSGWSGNAVAQSAFTASSSETTAPYCTRSSASRALSLPRAIVHGSPSSPTASMAPRIRYARATREGPVKAM